MATKETIIRVCDGPEHETEVTAVHTQEVRWAGRSKRVDLCDPCHDRVETVLAPLLRATAGAGRRGG